MADSGDPIDRRTLVKERHRRAIIDAAAALMDSTGGTAFTVDELAGRADVSRRTVFNHFASIDDVVITVCGEILGDLIDRIDTAEPAPGADCLFDEVAAILRSVDLVDPMAYLTRVLGGDDPAWSPRLALILFRAFTEISERMSDEVLRRRPDADELTVHLLIGALMSGLVVIHRHWFAETGAVVDAESRAAWARLFDKLLDSTRQGYGGTTS